MSIRLRWCFWVGFVMFAVGCLLAGAVVIYEIVTLRQEQVFPPQAYNSLSDVIRLQQLGVGVDGVGSDVTDISIYGESEATDSDLACLANWPSLRRVSLAGPHVTGAALKYLSSCTNLWSLCLAVPQLDDESLSHLVGLKNLAHLEIHGGCFSDKGLAYIGGLKSLTGLNISDVTPPVTDDGLAQIGRLEKLQCLELARTRITDAGLVHLASMEQLRTLYIGNATISDQGWGNLARLLHIEELSLSGTNVTGRGLDSISMLKNLRLLDVRETSVKQIDVQQLRHMMPGLSILGDGWKIQGRKSEDGKEGHGNSGGNSGDTHRY